MLKKNTNIVIKIKGYIILLSGGIVMNKLTNIKAVMCDVDGTLLKQLRKLEKKEFYLVYQQGVMFIALKHF